MKKKKEKKDEKEGGGLDEWGGGGGGEGEPVTIHQRISYLSTKDLRDDPPSVIK